MGNEDLLNRIRANRQAKVKFAITDIDGILRGKVISKEKFWEIAEKDTGFCDVVFGWDANDKCYNNITYTGWHTGYPDARARLDLSTHRQVPWDADIDFFLADFSNPEGGEVPVCPRTLLKKVIQRAEKMGFRALFSQEFEWFNFVTTPTQLAQSNFQSLQPLSPGMFGYSILRTSEHQSFFNELFDLLARFDIPVEGLHTETGPGVYEAAIRYDEALSAADKATLFKTAVKEIAYRHGLVATFMAKWHAGLPGCSGHLHQSLWDVNLSESKFFDSTDPLNMSPVMKSYLAGQLACLPYILPMFAPTVNSYKRLREGAWAPTTVTWGIDNRTTAIRVLNRDANSIRLEMRVPGSDSNPYLAIAASLASGIYGIANNLELEIPQTIGNGYKNLSGGVLPSNLWDATQAMKNSLIANELFGESFVDHFVKTREWEWMEFSKQVTDWELKRYFEII